MGLFDIFSNDKAEEAAAARRAGLQQGYDALTTNYGAGRDAIKTNYDAAAQPWQTVFDESQGGAGAYGDATGANGTAGYAKALDNFHTGPGFNASLEYGLQGIDRGAASRGMVTSGNTLMAEQKYGNDLGNQEFGNYVSRLAPYLAQRSGAAGGIAGVRTGEGNAINANYTGQGTAANANATGQGNATAAADLNNYNVSQNMWGALMQGGKMLAGAGGFA